MSVWMFLPYAYKKVENGEWTKEEADNLIRSMMEADLKQDEFDRKMVKMWRKLDELKS